MLATFKNGQTSVILRVKLLDSSSTTGAGLTGLTSSSSGLIIGTIADNEVSSVAYTQAGSTIEAVTTNGTYSAPTATKCRFKEVDSTNHKGIYELQFADARFAVSSAKSLLVSIAGVTNLAQTDFVIQLQSDDPYVAKPTNSNLLSIDASGRVDVAKINGVATSSVTTINANIGMTQPVNFTGTGASALVKSDMVDIAGAAVSTSTAQLGVNVVNFGGSAGTFSSGIPSVNASQWAGGTIPAVNVTGVPLVDLKYTLGTISPATAGYVAPDWAHIGAPTSTVNLSGTTIGAVTTGVTVGSSVTLTAGERNSIADALLDRDMSVGADSGSPTVRTPRQAFRSLRNKWAIDTTLLTVYKEDDSTASWTATIATTANANPVTATDPAGP